MSNTIIIYRREDANTKPRGFGNDPTYHIDKPYHSDFDMIWIETINITLPEGYTIAENMYNEKCLFDAENKHVDIIDDHGHPAIITGFGYNKEGKSFAKYLRLDK